MSNNVIDNLISSYNNPFDDFNANVLDPKMIMQYWFSPFNSASLKGFSEKKFYEQKMPIILQGSRGSGKTTILKYFSFPVQKERAAQNGVSLTQQLANDKGVGFYLRCDDSFLNMFKMIFDTSNSLTTAVFEHYVELFFLKNILDMLSAIEFDSDCENLDDIACKTDILACGYEIEHLDFLAISELVKGELHYINSYINNSIFTMEKFKPKRLLKLYEISEKLINVIAQNTPAFSDVNFLFLIDEFENLPTELQILFNTIIKFCRPHISLRVGRRSENIVTTATINCNEYLREGHDYKLIILDETQSTQELKHYLRGIAQKRLESLKIPFVSNDIIELLGEKEDLDKECSIVAGEKKLHMQYILTSNIVLRKDFALCKRIITIISNNDNKIAEMLNALWVVRSKEEDLIGVANETRAAMEAFFQGTAHPKVQKYRLDYSNKYRYALTAVLCSAYRKDKLYYSFNTICHLSEGNARTFINLCRAIINDALFYEKKDFTSTGRISFIAQARAIKEYANNEFNSVCSIIQDGDSIRRLIQNLGNIFKEFHKDRAVRYPETNQFVFDPNRLSMSTKEIIGTAESWSLIKKKGKLQRSSLNIAAQSDIYTINKIFSPLFNISYRTRGGYNIELTEHDIEEMLIGQYRGKRLANSESNKEKSDMKTKNDPHHQITLFDKEEM